MFSSIPPATQQQQPQTNRQESQRSLTTRYDYHHESIFIPFIRKRLKCISQDSLVNASSDKIFTVNQCVCIGNGAVAAEDILEPCSSDASSLISIALEDRPPPEPSLFKLAKLTDVMQLPIDAKHLATLCFPEYLLFSCNKDPAMHSFSKKPVNDQDVRDLLNPDNLVTVGGFSLSIEPSEMDEVNIFVSSKFSCSDEKIATLSILARANGQLQTIEEKRIEELDNPKTAHKVVRLFDLPALALMLN